VLSVFKSLRLCKFFVKEIISQLTTSEKQNDKRDKTTLVLHVERDIAVTEEHGIVWGRTLESRLKGFLMGRPYSQSI